MKRDFGISLMIFVALFGVSSIAFADSAPDRPTCSEDMDYSVSPNAPQTPTCKAIVRNVNLSNSPDFRQTLYILEHTYDRGGNDEYLIHKDGSINQPHNTGADYIAIDKTYVDSRGGLKGIFNNTTVHDPDFGDATVMKPVNEAEFSQNTFPIVVDRNDPDSGLEYRQVIQDTPLDPFVDVTNSYYIYAEDSTISPVASKEIVYTPLGFIQDQGKKKLVVYKTKIIFTLDNNKKSEKMFSPPTIEAMQALADAPTKPKISLFVQIWNVFVRFFRF